MPWQQHAQRELRSGGSKEHGSENGQKGQAQEEDSDEQEDNPAVAIQGRRGRKDTGCSRAKGTKARDDKCEERESDRGIKIRVLTIIDLFLLN